MLSVGDHVQVFSAFERTWVPGFAVAALLPDEDGYRLRRLSDGSLLPGTTGDDDLRRA